MAKIEFTKSEYDWIARQLSRLEERLKPNERKSTRFKLIKATKKSFDEAQTGDPIVVVLNRTRLRLLEEIIGGGAHVLEDRIIPAYEKRKAESNNQDYDEYLERATSLLATLQSAIAKVKGFL